MAIDWCNGWHELDERHRHYIEGELRWELGQLSEHPLHGLTFQVIAGCNVYDDFILLLNDASYAYVQLTWKAAPPVFTWLGDQYGVIAFIRGWKTSSGFENLE